MHKILVIDDDPEIYKFIKATLNPSIEITFCEDLSKAKQMVYEHDYNLVLIDLYFDKEKSLNTLVDFKLKEPLLLQKIIMMTRSDELDDEIDAHQLGVRDFIKKPLNAKLTRAVIEKHLFGLSANSSSEYSVGPFIINKNEIKAYIKNLNTDEKRLIELTQKEFQLLSYFLESKGNVLTRDQIIEKIWDFTNDTLRRTIDMHISSLRKKIAPHSNYIKTVRGVGYMFEIK